MYLSVVEIWIGSHGHIMTGAMGALWLMPRDCMVRLVRPLNIWNTVFFFYQLESPWYCAAGKC